MPNLPNDSPRAGRTVLIVEDDPEMLDYFERIVRDAGYRVLTATDGMTTLKIMRESKPDAVILDLMLPKYGGIELLYELQIGETKSIPVIVATARYTDSVARAAIVERPNVAAYFEKPVSPEALIKALREALDPAPPK
jgi:DNA-binding response OmpR family regulator